MLLHCNPDNAGGKQAFKDTVTLADLSQEFESFRSKVNVKYELIEIGDFIIHKI